MNVELGFISLAVLMGLLAMRVPIGLALGIVALADSRQAYHAAATSCASAGRQTSKFGIRRKAQCCSTG